VDEKDHDFELEMVDFDEESYSMQHI